MLDGPKNVMEINLNNSLGHHKKTLAQKHDKKVEFH